VKPAKIFEAKISYRYQQRGVTLLSAYAKNFLPWSVTSRPLAGDDAPTIDLVAGQDEHVPDVEVLPFQTRPVDLPLPDEFASTRAGSRHMMGAGGRV
jgi:hypothetical protein